VLNLIWVAFFFIAFITASIKLLVFGDTLVFQQIISELFAMAKTAFEIALGLIGILTLWLGIMKIGERSGMVQLLARMLAPLFRKLMPEVPADHPALGAIVMNMSANALGLDNAATPMGIKAMQELQSLNSSSNTASDAQILFLVINTSAVTILPIAVFTYRAQLGAVNPTDVFIPILMATYCSTLIGLLSVALVQRINLLDPVILAYFFGFSLTLGSLAAYFSALPQDQMQMQSALLSHILLFSVIILFLCAAMIKKVNAYEAFIEGAKEGFTTAVTIIPYLVAMLTAIGVFRACGALDFVIDLIRISLTHLAIDNRFVDALPTAFMKPFSGSGARAMFVDTMQHFGADSFPGHLASIIQGSTETTFYVLSVYFGAVGIKNIRHALSCGLIADLGGIVAAIFIGYWFFG